MELNFLVPRTSRSAMQLSPVNIDFDLERGHQAVEGFIEEQLDAFRGLHELRYDQFEAVEGRVAYDMLNGTTIYHRFMARGMADYLHVNGVTGLQLKHVEVYDNAGAKLDYLFLQIPHICGELIKIYDGVTFYTSTFTFRCDQNGPDFFSPVGSAEIRVSARAARLIRRGKFRVTLYPCKLAPND